MKRLSLLSILLFFLLLGFFSYTPDRQYHELDKSQPFNAGVVRYMEPQGWYVSSRSNEEAGREGGNRYHRVNFDRFWLEFSDNLTAFDPEQLELVKRHLKNSKEIKKNGVYLVVFIHGHNQNADEHGEESEDISEYDAVKFNNLLARFTDHLDRHFAFRNLDQKEKAEIPRVVGVFVGWRGEAINIPYVQNLSIGERAKQADAHGQNEESGVFRSLEQLSELIHQTNENNRMLVLGHSLGGRLLSQAMMKRFKKENYHPLGTRALAVGLEAAIGADCFADYLGANAPQLKENTDPSLWLLTSQDDEALGWPYRMASSFGVINPCRSSTLARIPVGHHCDFLTHRLSAKLIASPGQDENLFSKTASNFPDLLYPKKQSDSKKKLKIWTQKDGAFRLAFPYRDPNPKCATNCFNWKSSGIYEITFLQKDLLTRRPVMWNIQADRTLINHHGSRADTLKSTHNGYVSTNLTRLIIDYQYGREQNLDH